MRRQLHVCDFCGKTENETAAMVAGDKVDICDGCIALCVSVVDNMIPDGLGPNWPFLQELVPGDGPAPEAAEAGEA